MQTEHARERLTCHGEKDKPCANYDTTYILIMLFLIESIKRGVNEYTHLTN